jgi:hypothetical protein
MQMEYWADRCVFTTGKLMIRSALNIHSETATSDIPRLRKRHREEVVILEKTASAPASSAAFLIPVLSMFFEVGKRPRADISPTYTREAPSSYSKFTTALTTSGFVVVGFPRAETTFGFTSTVRFLIPIFCNPPMRDTDSHTILFMSFPPTTETRLFPPSM